MEQMFPWASSFRIRDTRRLGADQFAETKDRFMTVLSFDQIRSMSDDAEPVEKLAIAFYSYLTVGTALEADAFKRWKSRRRETMEQIKMAVELARNNGWLAVAFHGTVMTTAESLFG
jgi:hypothetical protein